ncbi:MAG: hypothetical protein ACYDG6_14650 [Thermincolia bacterium]
MKTFKELLNDKNSLIDQISQLIGEDYEGAVGLRGLYKTDDINLLDPSYVWDDGNWTDEQLNGTSVIVVASDWYYDNSEIVEYNIKKYADLVLQYGDGKIGLVVGQYVNGGEDIGEILIGDAKVIHVWDKKQGGIK